MVYSVEDKGFKSLAVFIYIIAFTVCDILAVALLKVTILFLVPVKSLLILISGLVTLFLYMLL